MRIKEKLQHIIKNSLINLNIEKKLNEIIIESSQTNGSDYYTNIAITLSKDLHKKPEHIAEMLKKELKDEIIEKIEITYPGIINIYLNKKYLLNGISDIINKNINYGKSNIGEARKINIDFVKLDFTKNLTKENLFNAIYSDNLARILKYNGFDIIKEFYINDTLKEIEKLAKITKERYENICKSRIIIDQTNNDMKDTAYNIYSLYREAKQNENIEYFIKEEISTLLEKNKRNLDKYRINYDIYTNENSLYDKGLVDNILDQLNKKGYTYFNEDKLWLKTTDFGDIEDQILIENDGTYTYLLPTISYYIDKINRKYNGIISMYDNEYKHYKNTVKPILTMLEQDINKIEIKILPKINIIKENNQLEDIDSLKKININDLRYMFALQQTNQNIDINLDILDKKEENPIYYIENTNAIIHNVLRNYNKKITKVTKFSTIDNQLAYIILNKLYDFEDIVILAGLKQKPNIICDYVHELAQIFNDYYKEENIVTEDEVSTNERLNLLLAIKIVINNALDLIGIIPREEM